MTLLDRVSAVLDERAIPHALIGAAALAAAGIARSTYDVDLFTGDARVLLDETWQGLAEASLSFEIRRGDDEDPLGGVVRLEQIGQRPVDVILAKHGWQTRIVERVQRSPGGAPPIVRPPDLMLLKLYAGGTQDLWDIRELLRLPDGDLWRATVETELVTFPQFKQDRWSSVRQ
jgi:hypothetical protein